MNTLLRKVLSLLLCVILLASTLFGALAVSVATVESTATAEATVTQVPSSAAEPEVPATSEADAMSESSTAVEPATTATPTPTVTPDVTGVSETTDTATPDVTVSPEPVTTVTPEPTATPEATVLPDDSTEPFLELGFAYIVAGGEATLVGYTDAEATELTLPCTLGGVKVTAIGERAFATLEKLAHVTLHEDIKTIALDAFPPSLRLITGPVDCFAQVWALEHGIAFEADATGATASPEPVETEAPAVPTASPEEAVLETPSAIALLGDTGTSEGFESEPCLLDAAQNGSAITVTLSGPADTEFWEIYGAIGDGEFALLATQPETSYKFADPTTLGQTYHFKARAGKSGEMYTAYSDDVSVTMRPGATVLNEPAWVDVNVLGFTWSPVLGATGYDVLQLDKDGHFRQVLPATVTGTSGRVSNLPAEEIWLAIRAYVLFEGKRVVSDLSNARLMTVVSDPAPVFKEVKVSQNGSVYLSWLKLPGVIRYTLTGSSSPDGSHATSYTLDTLNLPDWTERTCIPGVYGAAYYFTLEAHFASCVSRSVAKVWIPLHAPTVVGKVYDRDEENRERFRLTWNPLWGATGYSYGYIGGSNQEYHECGTTTPDICTATYWLDELPVGINIHLVLYGYQYDDKGTLVNGQYSDYITHRTFVSVPQIDMLKQIGSHRVLITPKNTGGETDFVVYYRYGTYPYTFSDYINSLCGDINLPYWFDTDIQIEFWICARDGVSGVRSKESEHRTLSLSSNYGVAITNCGFKNGKAYVYWNPVPDATGYVLQYTPDYGNVPFSDLATIPVGTTGYTQTLDTVESGTTVSYRIQCQGVPFTGDEPVRHLIIPCTVPVIQGISTGSVEKYQITVAPVSGADDYDFRLCPAGNTYYGNTFLHQSETLQLPPSSYKSGVAYDLYARANRYYPDSLNGVASEYSAKYPFIDLETPTVSANALNGTSLRIEWQAVTGTDGYELRYSVNGGEAESATTMENHYVLSDLPSNAEVTASVRAKRTLSEIVFQSTFSTDVTVILVDPPEPPELPAPTVQASGGWRYITDLTTGSVTVVGYMGTSATVLSVPEILGGAPVESIGSSAFTALPRLKQITLRGSIRYFPADAFASTNVVVAGYLDSPVQSLCREYGYRFIILTDDSQLTPNEPTRIGSWLLWVNRTTNTASIYGYDGPDSTEVLVPGILEGFTVTAIEPDALTHLTNVQKIYVPSSIQQIRRPAFPSTVTLYCVNNSAAHRYALATHTAYVVIDRVGQEKLTVQSLVQDSYNSITLQTNTLDFAQGFEVYRAKGDEPYKLLRTVKTSGALLLRDTGLTAGQTYCYQVRAYSDANYLHAYSELSPKVSIEIRVLPPTGLIAVQNAATTATLSWVAPKGVSGYELLARGEDGWEVLATVAGKTTLALKNLNQAEYTLAVRAYKTVGKTRVLSEPTEPVRLMMVYEVIPSILSATPSKDAKSVKIQWSAVTGAKGYRVYAADAPEGSFSLAGTLNGSSTTAFTHKFKIASFSQVIYYRVTAVVGTTESEPSPVVRVPIPCKPLPAPVLTFADFATPSGTPDAVSYFLRWNPVAGAVEYDVFITRTGQGKTVSYTLTTTDPFIDFPLDSEKGILSEYGYSFQVAAVFLCEDCGRVVGAKCAAMPMIVADAPGEPIIWQTSATSLSASWSKVTGASGYAVYYRRVGDSWWQSAKASASATVSLSKLQTGVNYELRVTALRKLAGKTFEGKSSSSVYWEQYVQYAPRITKCVETKVMDNYVNAVFTWTPVKGAIGYILYIVDGDIDNENNLVYYLPVRGTSATVNYNFFERQRYYPVTVTAVFRDGTESEFSNVEYLLTKPYRTGIGGILRTGSGGVSLRWYAMNKYVKVWRASTPTGKRELLCTTQQFEYIDTGLYPGVTYYYWLTTVAESPDGKTNESPFSSMYSFTY